MTGEFIPRRDCAGWTSEVAWLHNASDAVIGVGFLAIAVLILLFVRPRHARAFQPIFWLLGLSTISCAFTHFAEVLVYWWPLYWWTGVVKAVAAALAVIFLAMLGPLMPDVRRFPSGRELQDAVEDLRGKNRELSNRLAELATFNRQGALEILNLTVQRLDGVLRRAESTVAKEAEQQGQEKSAG